MPQDGSAALLPGDPTQIEQFRIVRRLGQGGMGVVFEAEDATLRRPVAIKLLIDPSHGFETRQRFLREARSAAAISDPNVGVIYQVGEAGGRVYIAMELVEGETLRHRLARGPIDVPTALDLGRQIAGGLAAAHAKGIVHRDLKPENVMLLPSGLVKLLDFGLAKPGLEREPGDAPSGEERTRTKVTSEPGAIIGTPDYMSPEQAVGEPVDVRSDVFSLGIVLYELLSGVRPFSATNPMALLVSIARDPAPSLRSRAPGVDEATEAVVTRCLEKVPAARFANAAEVAAALAVAADPLAASPRPRGSSTQSAVAAAATAASSRGPRWARMGAVAGALALAILAAAIHLGLTKDPLPPAAPATETTSGSVASEARKVVKMTDWPMPHSASLEALAAYREGVQAWHDGMNSGYQPLQRAAELDPTLAAAHLRLVEVFVEADQLDLARSHHRSLLAHLDQLSPRDQAIASALEPISMGDPPLWADGERRLRELSSAHPDDLGLLALWATVAEEAGGSDQDLAALAQVVEADPSFGLAWSLQVNIALRRDHLDAARALVERCVRQAPRSTGCWLQLADVDATEGRCAEVLNDGRRVIALSPEDGWGYTLVAEGLAAQGERADAIEAVWQQREAHAAHGELGEWSLKKARAALAVVSGDFTRAEELAESLAPAIDADAPASFRVREFVTTLRVELALERGDLAGAGRVAEAFVRARHAFAAPELVNDPTPFLLQALRRAGMMSTPELDAELERWRAEWRARLGSAPAPALWSMGEAATADGQTEAEAALRQRPAADRLPRDELTAWRAGHVSRLAGNEDDALSFLAFAAKSCRVLERPFPILHAQYELGLVQERLRHHDEACAAFRSVLGRWGQATPRSVTAEQAREHSVGLGCAASMDRTRP